MSQRLVRGWGSTWLRQNPKFFQKVHLRAPLRVASVDLAPSHQSLTGFDEHEDLCDEDLYGDHGGDVGGHHDNIG